MYRRAACVRLPRPPAADLARARAIIGGRVAHWAGVLELNYNRVSVKNQRTLWGSCSRRGNLNFSWRLAAAPPEALDYVVIHELCHLREMNHSKKFWAHVRAACPDYGARRRWLRDNTASLMAAASLN
jgi:predicted metal-dependent hydrolase